MSYELRNEGTHLHVRFFGVVESRDFKGLFEDFAKYEDGARALPHRISTLDDIDDFDIRFSAMVPIALHRAEKRLGTPIRSAIVASRPIERALASMLVSLNMNPNIDLRVFPTRSEAEAWIRGSSPAP